MMVSLPRSYIFVFSLGLTCWTDTIEWCCDSQYELCTQGKNQINVCVTNFASANANVSIAEANAVESSIDSSSTTSSSSIVAMSLSSVSSMSLQSHQSSTATTTSSVVPLQGTLSQSPHAGMYTGKQIR